MSEGYDDNSRKMVVPFLTDDPMFTLGVEFGMVYSHLNRPRCRGWSGMIHRANEEQVMLAANRMGFVVRKCSRLNKTWMSIRIYRRDQ